MHAQCAFLFNVHTQRLWFLQIYLKNNTEATEKKWRSLTPERSTYIPSQQIQCRPSVFVSLSIIHSTAGSENISKIIPNTLSFFLSFQGWLLTYDLQQWRSWSSVLQKRRNTISYRYKTKGFEIICTSHSQCILQIHLQLDVWTSSQTSVSKTLLMSLSLFSSYRFYQEHKRVNIRVGVCASKIQVLSEISLVVPNTDSHIQVSGGSIWYRLHPRVSSAKSVFIAADTTVMEILICASRRCGVRWRGRPAGGLQSLRTWLAHIRHRMANKWCKWMLT